MAFTSIEAFLEVINKSGVVEPLRLSAYLDKLRGTNALPADARKLATLMVREGLLTQFQASQLLAGRRAGFFIGKYKVLEKLGSGGMGTVYLAEHKFMKRRVAVKLLPPSKATDEASVERYYREAKASAALDHPNIVRAYDIDQDKHSDGSDLHFLVMEYVEGTTLQDLVKSSGPLEPKQAANYIAQAARALQHAFSVGLIHRDIKPGNILIDRQGVVKVLDMGLARFFQDNEDNITQKFNEDVLGTSDYLAPEQAIDSHGVDIRADIYSLGCSFYFTLTGNQPFPTGSIANKLIWHQTRQPKPIKEFRSDVPDELLAVIRKMMEKSASDRYQTPGDVVDALEPWTAGQMIPPSTNELPRFPESGAQVETVANAAEPAAATPPAVSPTAPTALRKSPSTATKANANIATAPATRSGEHAAAAQLPPPAKPKPTNTTGSAPNQRPLRPAPEPVPAPAPTPAAAKNSSAPPPAKHSPAPAVDVPPAPAPSAGANNDFSWDNMMVETGSSPSLNAKDTLKGSGRSLGRSSSRTKLPVPSRFSRRTVLLIGGIAAGVLVLGAILVVAIAYLGGGTKALSNSNPPEQGTGQGKKALYVSKSKVNAGDFSSIKEALAKAESGDQIIVRDREVYDEALVLNPTAIKRDVTLEAEKDAEGKTATLRATGAEPILVIDGVEGFRIKGFTLDGMQKCDDLVRINGPCSGSALEGLRLQGFNKAGIRLENCQGLKGKEVLFRNLRIEALRDKNQPGESAIGFGYPNKSSVGANKYLKFQECRFEGPYEAAIRLGSPVYIVTLERNLFYGGKAQAIAFPKDAPAAMTIHLQVSNNTFWDYQVALAFQQQPSFQSSFGVQNNLFYEIKPAVGMIENVPVFKFENILAGEGNIYDVGKSTLGNIAEIPQLKIKAEKFELPTADRNASDFLRYPKSSPLAEAGTNKSSVGALPPLQ